MKIANYGALLTLIGRRLKRGAQVGQLSLNEMLVMSAVEQLGKEATPSAIAAHVSLRSSNLAELLSDLEAKGFIVRRQALPDRRKTLVELSLQGLRILKQCQKLQTDWLRQAIKTRLTPDEQNQLLATGTLLEKLYAYTEADCNAKS
ncbi:MarR family winged helix-turn-helix transcriptional regulator [Pseudomonas asuensis]|uniref:HTH marR-type domain-containing protein n=1 Tax=Pseudomonas asuensis TaxID=1825787 RepID=A0ABQ2GY66_9PSED|nr:MarR family transcriptional regulator [Pseudomonas asuensis]GGM17984.1 hypothetical protein GCM10009425_31170 [Pseudomonas asuensis]